MSNRTGLILDFGGVLTTPLLPVVLAFEQREGLPRVRASRRCTRTKRASGSPAISSAER